MTFITDIQQMEALCPNVATIGFFDGVHIGHRFLVDQVRQEAAKRQLASLLVTFPQHPRQIMQPDYCPRLLSTFGEKCRMLDSTGADFCVVLPFTTELAAYSARLFMEEVLCRQLNVRVLVIGYDHRFGHNRSEGFADYVRYGEELGIEVVQAKILEGMKVSSSAIRKLLTEGKVEEASHGLGYRYAISGVVTDGFRIGRTLGFPTANLLLDEAGQILPADGVYAVYAHVGGNSYPAMLNIGCRPTFEGNGCRTVEAHLLHFDGDLYNSPMRIEFVKRIREEQRFDCQEELITQLNADEENVRQILADYGKNR